MVVKGIMVGLGMAKTAFSHIQSSLLLLSTACAEIADMLKDAVRVYEDGKNACMADGARKIVLTIRGQETW